MASARPSRSFFDLVFEFGRAVLIGAFAFNSAQSVVTIVTTGSYCTKRNGCHSWSSSPWSLSIDLFFEASIAVLGAAIVVHFIYSFFKPAADE